MITKFKLYETDSFEILDKSPGEIIKYVGDDTSGFNSREDAIEEVEYLLEADFPNGFRNFPDKVILYRLLLLDNGESINEDELGEHFTSESNLDIGFLEKIGIWENWSDDTKLWLLTCETEKRNIDIVRTIGNRLLFPRENEFTLLNSSKINIINKRQVDKKEASIF